MAIQQSINNMLGTLGTVSALGQHLAEQEKQSEIQKSKDLEKAGDEFVQSGKDAIRLMEEEKGLKAEQKLAKNDPLMKQAQQILDAHDPSKENYSYNELIKDENGDVYTPNQYLERGQERLNNVAQKLEANKYEQNQVRFRMKAQDARWAAQGISIGDLAKESKLNSPSEHKQIMKWKEKGGKK